MSVAICKFCSSWVGVVGEGSGGGSWVWVTGMGKKKYRNKELKKKGFKIPEKKTSIILYAPVLNEAIEIHLGSCINFVTHEVWVSGTFKIGDYGELGRLDRCHITQNTRDLLPLSFGDGTFSPGFSHRHEDKGETDKSCIHTYYHFSSKAE